MKSFFYGAAIVAALSMTACTGQTDSTTTTDSLHMTAPSATAPDQGTDTAGMGNWSDSDRDFAQKAARGGMLEVALGNLAKEKGTSQAVKDFGKMMVEDHTKANNELTTLLQRKNVPVSTAYSDDQQDAIDKLTGLSGNDFDKKYVDMMVDDHKDDVDDFKKAAKDADDPDLRSWAAQTLPTLEKHLDAIKKIKDGMK